MHIIKIKLKDIERCPVVSQLTADKSIFIHHRRERFTF